ncbi:amidohydrolase [Nonomuraea sp. NPDC059194]|uniref:amidohydrolase n=1 Tax=Nonomuraea sp. NPDC059194 TaxID=3346764 RepID=UPI00367A6167
MENSLPRRAVLISGALAAAFGRPASADTQTPADYVFTHGYVYTVDDDDSVHQALAVSGGRIVYVGTDKGAMRFAGKGTTVVDLGGRMLMPGLHDGHLHEMSGGKGLLDCDLKYAALTVEEVQATIQEYLDKTAEQEPGGWVSVVHWYQQAIRPAGTKLTKADLDSLNTRRPIVVSSSDGHTSLVNSRALELAGITAKTKDPSDGTIERDSAGEPTGILQDGAQDLVGAKIPAPTRAENLKIARTALAALAEQGVTTFMDAVATEEALRAFTTLAEQGKLTARAHFAPLVEVSDTDPVPRLAKLRRVYDDGRAKPRPGVSVHNAKLFMDGVLQYPAQTAALLEPYLVHKHDHWVAGKKIGSQYWTAAKLNAVVRKLAAAGFDPHIHAIGDRAVRTALDAYAAMRAAGHAKTRPAIAHAELVAAADLPRFGKLDVTAAMGFHWAKPAPDSVESVKPYLGPKRWARYEPEGDLIRAGGRVSLGSDWPVDPLDEWTAIKTVITRTAAPDSPFAKQGAMTPHQRISRAAAIRAATFNGAYQLRQDRYTGSLEAGKFADLIVLDRNVMKVPAEQIAKTKVLLTMVGGRIVHGGVDLD